MRGLSLIEVIICGLLGIILVYSAGRLFLSAQRGMNNALDSTNQRTSLKVVSGHLQKYMGTGDYRFFGFSGNSAGGDKLLGRYLIPQAGLCGDLSTTCTQDTAFLYVSHDKLTLPSVSVICELPNGNWLVDLENPTYGLADRVTEGFSVRDTGLVRVDTRSIVALINPPFATLWIVEATPITHVISQNPSPTCTLNPDPGPVCTQNLQTRAGTCDPTYELSKLYELNIRPYTLQQFTGFNTVSAAEARGSTGTFPLRLFDAQVRAIGRVNDELIISDCELDGSDDLNCTPIPAYKVPNVVRVRIDQYFKLRLFDVGAAAFSTANRFELANGSMTKSTSCESPNCETLNIASNSAMRVLLTAGESYEQLDDSGFSIFKQESLQKLRFRVLMDLPSGNQKEQNFEITF